MSAIPRDGDPQDIAEARSSLVRGLVYALTLIVVFYVCFGLAMLVVSNWRGW